MRKALFIAASLLLACAAAAAAGKLSEQARQKAEVTAAPVKSELEGRIKKSPLNLQELCRIESDRLSAQEEVDPLQSLYALRDSLTRKIHELNPYWEPEEKPIKEAKCIYTEYDISDLITPAPNRPAPAIGFGYGQFLRSASFAGAGIIPIGTEEEPLSCLDWGFISELLQSALPKDMERERDIAYKGGKMLCYITEEDARIVEELLKTLRQSIGYSVNIEVKFIRTTANYLRDLSKSDGGPAIYLTPEAEKRLLDDIVQKKDVQLAASSEVLASNRQMVHVREGKQVSLLMDYDINQIGIPTLQPVVRLINEGLICQFTPTVIRDGKETVIDVLATLSSIRKDIRKGEFMGGELLFPSMDMSMLHTVVQVPSGRAVLIGGVAVSSGDLTKESHEFIIYVKPTVNKKR
jgi:hypothetical protein